MKTKTLNEKINDFLKKSDLKYFKSNKQDNMYRILLPYRYHDISNITVFIDVYNDINLLKIGFNEKVSNHDIDTVKTQLLSKNCRLLFGSLSLDMYTNIVTYSMDWIISDCDSISADEYSRNILFILKVYEDLLSDNIISVEKGI